MCCYLLIALANIQFIRIPLKNWVTAVLNIPDMKVGIDRSCRYKGNNLIEIFWKTIKYEYIYIPPKDVL